MNTPQNAEDIRKIADEQEAKELPHKHLLALADLCRMGSTHVEFSFSGSGDEGDMDDAYSNHGLFECEYEEELRDWATETFSSLCKCDWYNGDGGGGTLCVRLPSLEMTVDSYYNVYQTVQVADDSYNLLEVGQ